MYDNDLFTKNYFVWHAASYIDLLLKENKKTSVSSYVSLGQRDEGVRAFKEMKEGFWQSSIASREAQRHLDGK